MKPSVGPPFTPPRQPYRGHEAALAFLTLHDPQATLLPTP